MKTSMLLIALIATFGLSGCATGQYKDYLNTTALIERDAAMARSAEAVAKSNENAAKYKAMADIAASGSESAKVAAVMAIALGDKVGGAEVRHEANKVQAPPPNEALQWASVLVPSLTNIAGMRYNYLSNATQSNNARDVAISTNNTFSSMGNNVGTTAVSIAGKIQAPAANITTTTTTTTMNGTGVLGSGTYTTNANPVLSGTGVIGSGTYSTDTHPVDNHTITTTDNHAVDNHAVDNHATNPTTVTPAGKVCTVNAGVLTCI